MNTVKIGIDSTDCMEKIEKTKKTKNRFQKKVDAKVDSEPDSDYLYEDYLYEDYLYEDLHC